jgi:uncharacterized NAD(P)/FAD-binding protein YdhS
MSLETKQMAALITALIQQNERLIEECERLQQKWEDLSDDTAEEFARYRKQIDLLQRTQPILR